MVWRREEGDILELSVSLSIPQAVGCPLNNVKAHQSQTFVEKREKEKERADRDMAMFQAVRAKKRISIITSEGI